jgi:hypothetical protein
VNFTHQQEVHPQIAFNCHRKSVAGWHAFRLPDLPRNQFDFRFGQLVRLAWWQRA